MTNAVPAGLAETARALLVSSRPLSWINTAFPFAAAYLMTARTVNVEFVVGALFFLVPYNLLMYGVNDVFDYPSDLRNPRKGGAEGALLDPALHRRTIAAGLISTAALGVPLAVWGRDRPLSVMVLVLSVAAVLAYSMPPLRTKERPLADSVTSSIHFVSPAVYGLALAESRFDAVTLCVLAAFFSWGMAAHAFGAVQDILPDRAADIASIATRFGARLTVRIAIGLWLAASAALLAAVIVAAPHQAVQLANGLAAALPLGYVIAVWPYRSVSDAESWASNRAWRRFLVLNFVCGFVVTWIFIALWLWGS